MKNNLLVVITLVLLAACTQKQAVTTVIERGEADYTVRSLEALKKAVEEQHLDLNKDGVTRILVDSGITITEENYQMLPIIIKHNMEITGLGSQEMFVRKMEVPKISNQAPYKEFFEKGKGKHQPIFHIPYGVSPKVVFRGLDFEGPNVVIKRSKQDFIVDGKLPSEKSVAILSHKKITVEQCHFHDWNVAIQMSGSHGSVINKNYFHHNSMSDILDEVEKLGYGIMITGATKEIVVTGNVFHDNKHAVSSQGHGNSSYIAKYNVIIGNSYSTNFDVHSIKDSGKSAQIAGGKLIVEENIWYNISSLQRPVAVRGTPQDTCVVRNNYFGSAAKYFTEKNYLPGYSQVKHDNNWQSILEKTHYSNNYWKGYDDSKSRVDWKKYKKDQIKEKVLSLDESKFPAYIAPDVPFEKVKRSILKNRLEYNREAQ